MTFCFNPSVLHTVLFADFRRAQNSNGTTLGTLNILIICMGGSCSTPPSTSIHSGMAGRSSYTVTCRYMIAGVGGQYRKNMAGCIGPTEGRASADAESRIFSCAAY